MPTGVYSRRKIQPPVELDEQDSQINPPPPGHCPRCALVYRLARELARAKEDSDLCALCEAEGA